MLLLPKRELPEFFKNSRADSFSKNLAYNRLLCRTQSEQYLYIYIYRYMYIFFVFYTGILL
jgi:hypothetical protein